MIAVVVWVIVRELSMVILISLPLLVGFLFLSFFYPLGSAHVVMKRLKENEQGILLNEINGRYMRLAEKSVTDSKPYSDETLSMNRNIETLVILYDKVKSMPEWPYDVETILKFIGIVIAPLLFIVIEHVIYP
jgi:hypothetical protein